MVLAKARKRKAIGSKSIWFKLLGYFCFVVMVAAIVAFSLLKAKNAGLFDSDEEVEVTSESVDVVETKPEEQPVAVIPDSINFQPVIDEWAGETGGTKSVIIYDLDRGEMAGSYNPDTSYLTASIYKLFVVYEGYRRVQSGEWQGDALAGSTGYDVKKCLDLSIRESYSPCAETLWSMIGHSELDKIVKDNLGLANTTVSSLVSNPRDVMAIMKLFYKHKAITDDDLVALMKDSFLNQPTTDYNWRQGLPSGFKQANVYNKVGWEYNGSSWNIYHDAAIVEFPEQDRHFIVVVMSNQLPFEKIRDLGSRIETTFYNSYQ